MSPGAAEPVPFPVGATAVRRDTLRGKVWSATPNRVLADTGSDLAFACWPGVQMYAPTTRSEWLRTGDDDIRQQAIPNLAAGNWDLGIWTWQDTTVLSRLRAGHYFSVHQFLGSGQRAGKWYVNFELPFRRTSIGIDNFDLLLDLVVDPESLDYEWKDEDEYAHGRRLGVIGDDVHAQVDRARQEVVALIGARAGPFALDWSGWQRDPDWPAPALPANALTLPARR